MKDNDPEALAASLHELRTLVDASPSQEQVDGWIESNRSTILGVSHGDAIVQLLRGSNHKRALMLFELAVEEKSASRLAWVAGTLTFVPTAALVLLISPSVGPLGAWFFLIFAAVGALFFGIGLQIYKHPKLATIYTQTLANGRTNFGSGRQGTRADGMMFMVLSLLFFAIALAGDTIFSALS